MNDIQAQSFLELASQSVLFFVELNPPAQYLHHLVNFSEQEGTQKRSI